MSKEEKIKILLEVYDKYAELWIKGKEEVITYVSHKAHLSPHPTYQ